MRVLFVGGVTTFVLLASCLSSTQVTIEARTNVAYRAGIVTAFTVGSPGQTEHSDPTTETLEAWGADGLIGTLAVVPESTADAALSVKVVMGVRRSSRECLASADGCIIARRTLQYVPNRQLRLPIVLYAQCEGVACDEDTTCNILGQCVSAAVDMATCDTPEGCGVPDDPRPGEPGGFDGGAVPPGDVDAGEDALVAADSSTDPGDAASDAASDADGDAPSDAMSDAFDEPGLVWCGKMYCRTGTACCFDPTSNGGTCTSGPCEPPDILAFCDGLEDCPDEVCCYVPSARTATCRTTSACSAASGFEVCHSSGVCSAGTCTGLYAERYRYCE